MLILVLGTVSMSLIWWFFVRREQPVGPIVRYVGSGLAIVCLGLLTTLRAGPLVGLLVVVAGSLVLWLRLGGFGGGGGGDDGPGSPPDPEPEPGPAERSPVPRERLDQEAFDRARAEWERELPKHS